MKFAISSVAALVVFIGSAFAQTEGFDSMTVPTDNQVLNAGETLDITWEYTSEYAGKVTIALLQGASPSTLQVGDTIAGMSSLSQMTVKSKLQDANGSY